METEIQGSAVKWQLLLHCTTHTYSMCWVCCLWISWQVPYFSYFAFLTSLAWKSRSKTSSLHSGNKNRKLQNSALTFKLLLGIKYTCIISEASPRFLFSEHFSTHSEWKWLEVHSGIVIENIVLGANPVKSPSESLILPICDSCKSRFFRHSF